MAVILVAFPRLKKEDVGLQHLYNVIKRLTEFEEYLGELKSLNWTDEEGKALQSMSDSTSEAKKHLRCRGTTLLSVLITNIIQTSIIITLINCINMRRIVPTIKC